MRRIAAILAGLLLLGGFVVLSTGAGDSHSGDSDYVVELDNAFGLIEGADLKVAGVRAGKIESLKLDRDTNRALVGIRITKDGFGSLRSDVHCESRPQSLIGEYFLDCLPGTSATVLPKGSRIPVSRTSSTIGPDLVGNILRRPYRERLAVIVNELGAAVAGNAGNLNDAIRRAVPALRETDKVLAKLARQNRTLAELTTNADKVIGDMAANRGDVKRWVQEARDTAVTSAERKADIALGFHRLPGFLEELRPTMAALGATADAQTPTLRNLSASAKQLERLFEDLPAFSDANRPALRALARASATGQVAAKAATPVVAQLRRFASGTPELGGNLSAILRHLDDPKHAVEDDPRAARATGRAAPTGYSGLEALLTYAYDQTQSTNVYDATEHVLKVGIIPPTSPCADYADKARYEQVKAECDTHLGPNQPGLNFTDPTKATPEARAARRRQQREQAAAKPAGRPAPSGAGSAAPATAAQDRTALAAPIQKLLDKLLPGRPVPAVPVPSVPSLTQDGGGPLLDFLLGP